MKLIAQVVSAGAGLCLALIVTTDWITLGWSSLRWKPSSGSWLGLYYFGIRLILARILLFVGRYVRMLCCSGEISRSVIRLAQICFLKLEIPVACTAPSIDVSLCVSVF
jgi:hypothetical protein